MCFNLEVEMMVDDPLEFPHLVETDVEDDSTVADAPYIYVTQKDLDSRCTSPEGGSSSLLFTADLFL